VQLLWEEEVASLLELAPTLPVAARALLRATLESIVSEENCDRALAEAAAPLLAELEPNVSPSGAALQRWSVCPLWGTREGQLGGS
jgi:hypothetical protein